MIDLIHMVGECFVPPARNFVELPNPEFATWIRSNFLVLRWMRETISPLLCPLIQKEVLALPAWKTLR